MTPDGEQLAWIAPDWPAPANVRALTSLRAGGVSIGSYESLNVAMHVGDDPEAVAENRRRLLSAARVPAEPCWLEQVHGTRVIDVGEWRPGIQADAACGRSPGEVCVVLTADCLPILLCDRRGDMVAAVHAGWRGLAGGIVERALSHIGIDGEWMMAWLGPAIGIDEFEVGDEVRERFVRVDAAAADMFRPGRPGHWMADFYGLARLRLRSAGVSAVYGGGWCTVRQSDRFYSYRRQGHAGRMASLIWSV